MTHLNTDQRALLETALLRRLKELDQHLAEHHDGLSRAEHAHELLEQNGHDAPQREGERQLDMALSDRETLEMSTVSLALARLREGAYGRCADCDEDIPFGRLQAEPWATRCIDCETEQETARRRMG